jgi:hypothetical protein
MRDARTTAFYTKTETSSSRSRPCAIPAANMNNARKQPGCLDAFPRRADCPVDTDRGRTMAVDEFSDPMVPRGVSTWTTGGWRIAGPRKPQVFWKGAENGSGGTRARSEQKERRMAICFLGCDSIRRRIKQASWARGDVSGDLPPTCPNPGYFYFAFTLLFFSI